MFFKVYKVFFFNQMFPENLSEHEQTEQSSVS